MKLEVAVKGMMNARDKLRTRQGVTDPVFISEQMQRLTQYTGAVEEHLAELEEEIELQLMNKFNKYLSDEKSINQAEILARFEVGAVKGEIAKLKRYVNSSWQIVSVAQSRHNHLNKSNIGQI